MFISKFQLGNYKSFNNPPALEFRPGFNIITGQNNAGKTALLEALGLTWAGNPHRSLNTVPGVGAPLGDVALTEWMIEHGLEELREIADMLVRILETSAP